MFSCLSSNKENETVKSFITEFNNTEGSWLMNKFGVVAPDTFKNVHAVCDVYIANYYEHYDKVKENFTDPEEFLKKCYKFVEF